LAGNIFSRKIDSLKKGLARSREAVSGGISRIAGGDRDRESTLSEIEELLIGADIGVRTAAEIVEKVRQSQDKFTAALIRATVRQQLIDLLTSRPGPHIETSGKPHVIIVVGVNGTGKTTTIAKLAATYGVIQKRKVEMVTIDSYRIAAIEQLGKYAELMQIPFTVVNTREEFKNVIMNSKSEIIFVDTAGRSQKNNLGLAEMRNILDGAKTNLDIHLVLSATTKYRDAVDIITRFNQLMYNKVIITKLDETNTIGSVLSIMNPEKKLSYFTNGQSVPDDIEIADKEKLFEMIAFEELCAG